MRTVTVVLHVPLQSVRSFAYFDLEKFADAVVEVPENSMTSVVDIRDGPAGPHPLRNLTNSFGFAATSVVLTGLVLARSSRLFDARFAGTVI